MYHHQAYTNNHKQSLTKIGKSKCFDQLALSQNQVNCQILIVKILNHGEEEIIKLLQKKKNLAVWQCIMLNVCLQIGNKRNSTASQALKSIKNGKIYAKDVQTLMKYIKLSVPNTSNLTNHRQILQKLQQKAQQQRYFDQIQVPVYLVSSEWLQLFRSESINQRQDITIRNQQLAKLAEYTLADHRYTHYNIVIQKHIRERQHFQLVSYQAWKFLNQHYGGLQIKRFTANKLGNGSILWYPIINIIIVQQRCVFHSFSLQVSIDDSCRLFCDRLIKILKDYAIVPNSYLSRNLSFYVSKGLKLKQIIKLLQNDDRNVIKSSSIKQIQNISVDMKQLQLFAEDNVLIVNITPVNKRQSIFDIVQPLIITNNNCLTCSKSYPSITCTCLQAKFCSKTCQNKNNTHSQQCNKIIAKNAKRNELIKQYQCNRLCFYNQTSHSQIRVGLQNLNNTCYMNAALQCIFRITALANYFIKNQHLKQLNVDNQLGSQGHLACAFGELIKEYYTTNRPYISPKVLQGIININPQFQGCNQQDSQQFLNYFLDKLHEDLARIQKPQAIQNKIGSQIVVKCQNQLQRNHSIVSDMLFGQYRSEIQCPDCKHQSVTLETFLCLSLQFPKIQNQIKVKGYHLRSNGELRTINVLVRKSVMTGQFVKKYFNNQVQAVYQIDRRITNEMWDLSQKLVENMKKKGILFFIEKQLQHDIQMTVQFEKQDARIPSCYSRRVFVKHINDLKDLKRAVLSIVRAPLQTALQKSFGGKFLNFCQKQNILTIFNEHQLTFPLNHKKITIKIELNIDHLNPPNPLKLNTATSCLLGNQRHHKSNSVTIQQMLDNFSYSQTLTNDNAWFCQVCKQSKLALKRLSLYKMPQFLIIHLKRFKHKDSFNDRVQKINTAVYPKQIQRINNIQYELFGMVIHKGKLQSGHYTSLIKWKDWIRYDDKYCQQSQLNQSKAYLLFYQRKCK